MFAKLLVAAVATLTALTAHAGQQDGTEALRELLEASLRETAGIGFRTFGCDIQPPLGPGDRFVCQAMDEEGDRLRYTIEVEEGGGATVVRADQSASSLAKEDQELFETPSLAFIDAYAQGRWQELFDQLHPSLQKELGDLAAARRLLGPMRDFYGEVEQAEPVWLRTTASGEQHLEYLLHCNRGKAEARFGFASEDAGQLKVSAFVIIPTPGSPEQTAMLQRRAVALLSPAIGATIDRIEAPFEMLIRRGDTVEGTAWLANGREILFVATQHGVRDDFDTNDYRFSVLEVEFLLERALRPQIDDLESVKCASRTVPDGGTTQCTAIRASGEKVSYKVQRNGGDHRMFPAKTTQP